MDINKSDFDLGLQTQSTNSKIIVSLERISQAFRVLLWQESKEFSLSPIQVQVLIFLAFHSEEKRTVSYLAGEFNMAKATISETIKTLEQKGLISKVYGGPDTRSYTINLTEKGKSVAENTSLFTQQLTPPLDKMRDDDKEKLLLSLSEIIHHLNKTGIITIQRMCYTCAHYLQNHEGEKHYCQLLNKPLKNNELRVDCPEHVLCKD